MSDHVPTTGATSRRMTTTDRGYLDSDVETGRSVNYAAANTPAGKCQSRREVSSDSEPVLFACATATVRQL